MSKDSSFRSSQNIPQEATQQKKLTKVGARYIEIQDFKDSDHHKGYFCYNCTYFVKPHHCAIVTDEVTDILGHSSGVIAPHGICSIVVSDFTDCGTIFAALLIMIVTIGMYLTEALIS
jgi:hypothetical protein